MTTSFRTAACGLAAGIAALLLAAPPIAHAQHTQGRQAPTSIPDAAMTTAGELRRHVDTGTEAWNIVESLTTEVGPRMAGSAADARAVEWAKAKFRELGYDKVYTEPVTFPVWHRGVERAEVVSPFPQPLTITALGGSVGTRELVQARIVRFPDLLALSQAPRERVEGRIVFIDNRMQRFKDGSGYGPAVAARGNGASEGAKKGARAVLIRSIGTDSDRMPHTGLMRYAADAGRIPAAALSNPDADLLTNMLKRGQPVMLRLRIDAETRGEYTSQNVIGEITGREKPDEVVTIGGHLDSWDLGTGAIDDGAGVALTMAAGKLIGDLKTPPRRTIRVIAYANEEQGLFGGRAYAEAHAAEVAGHQIGAESDFGAGRVYAFRSSAPVYAQAAAKRIGEALQPLGIEYLTDGKGGPGPDVGPMAERGMAWAQLAQDGTDYFDYHHTANDTLDKIDPKALDQNAVAYAVFAYLAAEAEGDFGSAPGEPKVPQEL